MALSRLCPIACAIFLLGLVGCVTTEPTKPNAPYEGLYPAGFDRLAAANPLLAREIGKLPEVRDGLSAEESDALTLLFGVRDGDPVGFDAMYAKMHAVGKPEVRKFDAPLQAYFWLAMGGDESRLEGVRDNYDLESLLDATWRRDLVAARMLATGSRQVALNPTVFERAALRWGDFSQTVDRLSAPELANYYARNGMVYQSRLWNSIQSPAETFARSGGVCRHFSTFVVYALERAGYHARNLSYKWGPSRAEGHTVGVVRYDNGRYWVVVNTSRLHVKSREYGSYDEIIADLAGKRGLTFTAVETNGQLLARASSY